MLEPLRWGIAAAHLVGAAPLLSASEPSRPQASVQERRGDTENSSAVPSEGLWEARLRYGPDVRGRVLLFLEGRARRAEIAGQSVAVHTAGDTVWFALPDSAGSFSGRLSRDRTSIFGHWVQPRIASSGNPYASPLHLTTDRAGHYVGNVEPLDDVMTLYLRVRRQPDGTLVTFLRNPERNLGRQLRAERLERLGNEVRLMGRLNGAGRELVLAKGEVTPSGFSLHFEGRGIFDFRRVADEEYSDFYPRGRPTASYTYRQPPLLNDGWSVGTPQSVGLSQDSINRFVGMLINQSMDSLSALQVHAVLIVRHGKLLVEEYFHGEHRDKPHDTRSAAKSITATLTGAAIHAGVPLSLSSPVYAIMNGGRFPSDLESRKRRITLEHLLGMSAGIDCDDSDPNSAGAEDRMLDQAEEPDYYRFTLRLATVREPGTKAVYCSVQPNLVGGVLKHAAGRALPDLFHDLLAAPLGIKRYYLNLSPTGDPYMGGGVRLTAREFAKFGQLYLDGGVWHGRRILDRAFVERASSPRYDLSGIRYGLLWWVIEYPFAGDTLQAYFAAGNGGQLVMVIPRLDLVVTTLAASYADPVLFDLQRRYIPTYILPAVKLP